MLSNIGSTNWYGLAATNNYKLAEIMSDRLSASSNSTSAVEKIQAITSQSSSLGSDTVNFLKEYQNHMNSLNKLAKNLSSNVSGSVANKVGVSTSNTDVLEVTAGFTMREPASYAVDVQQIAKAQVNTSAKVKGSDAPTASGSFVLETQNGTYSFDIDPSQAETNKELYQAIAQEINDLDTGVTAEVVKDGENISLTLTGDKTGSGNGFLAGGDFNTAIGLNEVTQQAQNAVYTVSRDGVSKEFNSADNQVYVGGYQIQATLKGEGKATVTAGVDMEQMETALGKLVDEFNDTLDFLAENSDRGVGVMKQLRRLVQPPTSQYSMQKVGIVVNEDGKYTFDKETFRKTAGENPSLVKEIVSGSYGIAQGLQRDAQNGMNMPSASLVSTEVRGSQSIFRQTNNYDTMMNLMSIYSKNGSFNMNNLYTMGMLINMYA